MKGYLSLVTFTCGLSLVLGGCTLDNYSPSPDSQSLTLSLGSLSVDTAKSAFKAIAADRNSPLFWAKHELLASNFEFGDDGSFQYEAITDIGKATKQIETEIKDYCVGMEVTMLIDSNFNSGKLSYKTILSYDEATNSITIQHWDCQVLESDRLPSGLGSAYCPQLLPMCLQSFKRSFDCLIRSHVKGDAGEDCNVCIRNNQWTAASLNMVLRVLIMNAQCAS